MESNFERSRRSSPVVAITVIIVDATLVGVQEAPDRPVFSSMVPQYIRFCAGTLS